MLRVLLLLNFQITIEGDFYFPLRLIPGDTWTGALHANINLVLCFCKFWLIPCALRLLRSKLLFKIKTVVLHLRMEPFEDTLLR